MKLVVRGYGFLLLYLKFKLTTNNFYSNHFKAFSKRVIYSNNLRCGSHQVITHWDPSYQVSTFWAVCVCARNHNLKKDIKLIPILLLSFVLFMETLKNVNRCSFSQIKYMYYFHFHKTYMKHKSKPSIQVNFLSNLSWLISFAVSFKVYDGLMIHFSYFSDFL